MSVEGYLIPNYCVVRGTIPQIERECNGLMAIGYKPIGGLTVIKKAATYWRCAQVMYLDEGSEEE